MDSTDESSINDKPLILVGPYEHHSNLLPWRELGNVDIKTVNLDPRAGNMDLDHLKFLLEQHASRKVKIGAFSAASNVTGVIADDCAITALLHQYGALSIWDYATGASYLDVQMNPRHPDYSHAPELLAKDAVVLSGHKLLGGVGTPGVLIIKKHLVSQQNPPSRSGGGTVFYVTANHHRYLSNRIERFEGGTPNIVGIWRLGLVVTTKSQLKKAFEQLSSSDSSSEKGEHTKLTVLDYDLQRARRIQKELSKIKNLVLMDALHSEDEKYVKLPVFSFLIKCGVRFLHYNYVCAILNDLFGIQSRGGCQCAGPFAQYLLGLHGQVNKAVEECLDDSKAEILRPGFSRLSLPTLGTTKAIEDYVIKAIDWVARNGWKLMHLYQYNQRTGVWRHKSRRGTPLGKTEPNQLSHYRTPIIKSTLHERNNDRPFQSAPTLDEALHAADELLQAVLKRCSTFIQATKTSDKTDEDSSSLSDLRWYVYPKDVAVFLNQGCDEVPGTANRYLLLGAVRPVAWFPIHNVQIPAESGETKALKLSTRMHLEVAMAKKNPNDLDCRESSLGPMHYPEREIAALGAQNCTCDPTTGVFYPNDWVSFEDGEYFGQAPISKIEAGYHNGDLSSACMLYHTEGDEWERIDLFLARQHRLTTNSLATKTTVTDCSFDTKVLDDKTSLSTNRSHQLAPASGDVATLDLNMVGKDKNKKVQRDASTLGKRAWFRPLRLRFEKGKKGNPQTTPTPTNALG